MSGWKRAVVCCLAQAVAPAAEGASGGILVSPEFFELTSRWAAASAEEGGVKAALASAAPKVDLATYVRLHAPAFTSEATSLLSRLKGDLAQTRTAQGWPQPSPPPCTSPSPSNRAPIPPIHYFARSVRRAPSADFFSSLLAQRAISATTKRQPTQLAMRQSEQQHPWLHAANINRDQLSTLKDAALAAS